MRILWVSPTPFYPNTAGNRAHIYNLIKRFQAAGHDIIFLLYNQENAQESDIREMQKIVPTFVVPHTQKRTKSFEKNWGIDDWFSQNLANSLELFVQTGIDAIVCEYVFMSKALTLVPSTVIKILDCHDRMSDRHEMLIKNGIKPDFFYTTKDQEAIALNRADIILGIQEEEVQFFKTLTKKLVLNIGYWDNEEKISNCKKKDEKLRIGVMASSNSLNRKSIKVFQDALSEAGDISNKVTFVIAGTIGKTVNADVDMGFVKDQRTFYENIDLCINPMIDGTGLKIKTISTINQEIPFLSTASGSVGLDVVLPEHKCNSPREFIPYIRSIVKNRQRLEDLKKESQRLKQCYNEKQNILFSDFFHRMEKFKKRILIVTDIAFWIPGPGSHSRIYNLYNEISKKYLVDIFFLGTLNNTQVEEARKCGLAHRIKSSNDYNGIQGRCKLGTSIPDIGSLRFKRNDNFFNSFSNFSKTNRYDVVIFEYIHSAYLKDALGYSCLTILDTHDVMAYRT